MVKANFSFGSKLLLILVTVILYTFVLIGGLAAGAFYVYKNVKVRDLANTILGDSDWISEDYNDTIEGFVAKVKDAFSGELTIGTVIDISPRLGEMLDSLVGNVENVGLFTIDTQTLYAAPVKEISSKVFDVVVFTASLSEAAEKLGVELPSVPAVTGDEQAPVWFYTQVNKGDDGALGEIDKAFTMSEREYTYYTRSTQYFSTYTRGGEELPVVRTEQKDLYFLAGVTEEGGVLRHEGRALYLGTSAAGAEGGATAYTRLNANNAAVWEKPSEEGGCTFALSPDQKIYTVAGPAENAEDGFVYEEVPLGESTGTAAVNEIAAPYKYTPLYVKEGENFLLATAVDEKGAYVINTDDGGYLIDEKYRGSETLYYAAQVDGEGMDETAAAEAAKTQPVFVKSNGIASLPLIHSVNALSAALDMSKLTLADADRYFGVDLTGNAMLEHVVYVPLGIFSSALSEEIQNIRLSDVMELNGDSPRFLLSLAYGDDYVIGEDNTVISDHERTLGELTLTVEELTLKEIIAIDPENEDTAPLLIALKDWSLGDFSNADKINSLSLGDVLKIDPEKSAKILLALENVSLGNLSEALNAMSLGDIIDIPEEDALLGSLKNSTLETLADDIAALDVQALYADGIYKPYATGYLVAEGDHAAAVYGETHLYVQEGGSFREYTDLSAQEKEELAQEPLYSNYQIVKNEDLSAYAGAPLYCLVEGEEGAVMQLATGVTGWKLPYDPSDPESIPEGLFADTKFYIETETGYAAAEAENGVFKQDTLWYYDFASEQMCSLSLTPASYGLNEKLLGEDGAPAVTLFTRLTRAQAKTDAQHGQYYTQGNLYTFDAARQKWTAVPTRALYGDDGAALKDGDGNVIYLLDLAEGETAPAALYTYGEITGIWKYLLTRGGAEQACTLQEMDSLVSNVSGNINSAKIGDLYADGIIQITAAGVLDTPLDAFGDEYKGLKLSDLTITQTLDVVFKAVSIVAGA